MKVKLVIFILVSIFLINLVSAVTITDTTFTTSDTNYSIYVNGSITLTQATVTNESIIFDNVNTTGTFTNPNDTYDSQVNFVGLTSPYTKLTFDNGTVRAVGVSDVNITIPAGRFFYLQDARGYSNTELSAFCESINDGYQEFGQLLVLIVLAIVLVFVVAMFGDGRMDIMTFLTSSIMTIVFVAVILIVGVIINSSLC